MGILDDAIKEHLELKRQHGADEAELKQLEDEAFGAAERPGDEAPADPIAEAPTEFLTQPDLGEDGQPDAGEDASPEGEAPPEDAPEDAEGSRRAPRAEIADLQEAPEELPITEQPTEMFDLEEELAAEERAEQTSVTAPEADEDVADADADSDEDDFWDEKRLSDELDQALDGPFDDEDDLERAEPEQEVTAPPPDQVDDDEPDEPRTPPASHHEDVLEERPEFLEDEDDDDLWFEQKPPKDFDFDD